MPRQGLIEYGIAGLIGEGLKGFADSYGAEKDRQRKQAEGDMTAAMKRREMKLNEEKAGKLYNEETDSYSDLPGFKNKREQDWEDWRKKADYQNTLISGREKIRAKTGVQLPAGEVSKLAEGDSMTGLMAPIGENIKKNADIMGPLKGRVGGLNPYNTRAQVFDADMKMAAQKIGTFLEGGKMTDKDVPKYRAMLPNIFDTPEVAQGKLANVTKLLQEKQAGQVDSLNRAGFKVDNFKKPTTGVVPQKQQQQTEPQTLKGAYTPGTVLTLKNGQRVRVGSDGDTLEPIQ